MRVSEEECSIRDSEWSRGLGDVYKRQAYLSELLHVYTPSRTLRSSSDTRMLEIQQYNLDPTFGIHSHKTLDTAQPCHLLKPN